MQEMLIRRRNNVLAAGYSYIFKPLAFKTDPEWIHDRMVRVGEFSGRHPFLLGIIRGAFGYTHPMLTQTFSGITFSAPVGLAAGFDKDAQLIQVLPSCGFGYAEVGSVTARAYAGNKGKRLWRLPESKSLMVYYGLKNEGANAVAKRIQSAKRRIPIGISVAKSNCKETVDTEKGIADYVEGYTLLHELADYVTINISCPNAFGGEPFTDAKKLEALLKEISKAQKTCPVFLKIAHHLTDTQRTALIDVALVYNIDGFVCANLGKERNNPLLKNSTVPAVGGYSGLPIQAMSTKLISDVYAQVQGKAIVIGCGGIFSAEDAYEKIKAGASLLQMITGMIYCGPQVISSIHQGLVVLLKKDGYASITEAIGANHCQ